MQNYNAKLKIFLTFSATILIFAILIFILNNLNDSGNQKNLDSFAQCLTDKGYTMYGAYWCPHCQNEKKEFGDSFRLISYVECTKEPKKCVEAGIQGYPTWISADGKKLEGEQGIKRLSEISGCSIIQ